MSKHANLYGLKAWQSRRTHQLTLYPLCAYCLRRGLTTEATVADHVKRHNGDPAEFFGGDLQSLCKPCHDSVKQQEEEQGFSRDVGTDGWPIDAKHPVNTGAPRKKIR